MPRKDQLHPIPDPTTYQTQKPVPSCDGHWFLTENPERHKATRDVSVSAGSAVCAGNLGTLTQGAASQRSQGHLQELVYSDVHG